MPSSSILLEAKGWVHLLHSGAGRSFNSGRSIRPLLLACTSERRLQSVSHNNSLPNRCSVERSALLAATIQLSVSTSSSHNSPAWVSRERRGKARRRWRPRCSSAWPRLKVFVAALICNQASSRIRAQLLWKGRQAPFYLHRRRTNKEKVPADMMRNSQDFRLYSLSLACCWQTWPALSSCCCVDELTIQRVKRFSIWRTFTTNTVCCTDIIIIISFIFVL